MTNDEGLMTDESAFRDTLPLKSNGRVVKQVMYSLAVMWRAPLLSD